MRVRRVVLVGLCTAILLFVGCLHIRRKVDVVSKFNLQDTVRIVVGLEESTAGFEVNDKAVIETILSDLRKAHTAPWLKYATIAWATFFDSRGRQVDFEVYGSTNSIIFRRDNRFYEFRSKLKDMIVECHRESRSG
jgi:hypothetical protein